MSVEALNEGPPHPPPPGTPRTSRGRDFQPPSRSASAPNGADQQPEAADPDHGESCVKGGELPTNHESKSLGVPGYRRRAGGGAPEAAASNLAAAGRPRQRHSSGSMASMRSS